MGIRSETAGSQGRRGKPIGVTSIQSRGQPGPRRFVAGGLHKRKRSIWGEGADVNTYLPAFTPNAIFCRWLVREDSITLVM